MSEQATAEERSHDLEGSLLQDARPPSWAPTSPLDHVSSVLRQIANQERRDRDFAVYILTWLMFAKLDLWPEQLEQAYAIQQPGDASNRDFSRPGEAIVSVCKGLVRLETREGSKRVKFVFRPDLDQLLHYGLVDPKPHLTIIRTCLTCLQSDEFVECESRPETMERLRQDEGLLTYYAATRWMGHLPDMDAESGELAEGEELITQFILCGKGTTGWFRFLERFSNEEVLELHVAAIIGQVPVMKNILETRKHGVNATTSYGRTALHLAAKHKRASVVRMLLENSARLDIQDAMGNTALHFGAMSNTWHTPGSHLKTVQELLDAADKDFSSICTAIRNGSNKTPWDYALEAARMLRPPRPEESDWSQRARAKMAAHYEIVKLMTIWPSDESLKHINPVDYLPLVRHVMALESLPAVEARLVDGLFQGGRIVDGRKRLGVKDLSETTPTLYAIGSTRDALVDMLHEEKEKSIKPLTDAYERQLCFMAWILLQTGADATGRRRSKPSALHSAIRLGSKSLVSLLLAYRADVEIRHYNRTPLDLAIELGETDIVRQLLVKDGADIRKVTTDMMFTALRLAILHGRKEMIHMLSGLQLTPIDALKEEAKVTLAALVRVFRETVRSKNLQGSTVLHLALSSQDRSSCYEMLLSMLMYGADVDAEDEKGRMPLMLAKELGLHAERILLEMHSSKPDMEQQAPAYQLQQAPGHQRQQAPGYQLQQAPGHQRQQVPAYQLQQAPGYQPQQVPAYQLQQAPGHQRQQVPAYQLQQAPGHQRQQVPGHQRQQVPGHQRQQVPGHQRQQVPDHRRQRD